MLAHLKILEKLAERARRILTCRVSKFPCSVLLALSTNEIQAQISWVGQSTIAECPWAFKIARWKKTTTTDRGESRPHCRAARAGKLQSSELWSCGPRSGQQTLDVHCWHFLSYFLAQQERTGRVVKPQWSWLFFLLVSSCSLTPMLNLHSIWFKHLCRKEVCLSIGKFNNDYHFTIDI